MDIENIETILPGVVVGVNSDGTVDVKPRIRKVSLNGVFDVVNPAIKKVPLMKLGGKNAEFLFEPEKGDSVLLVSMSRDATKWKKSLIQGSETEDCIPDSASGLTINDLVAIPIVHKAKEGAASFKVLASGDIQLTPATGGKVVVDSDLDVKGSVKASKDITAEMNVNAHLEVTALSNTTGVSLSKHTHSVSGASTLIPTPTGPVDLGL